MPLASSDANYPPAQPSELPADPKRQAVAPIRGFIYQFLWSVDAWLQLKDPDEVIYLEGAEDLDVVQASRATAKQVKSEAEPISLNNQRAHKVLENFWTLCERAPTREIEFHYISTAETATEQDADFGGACGIETWSAARTDTHQSERLQSYLLGKLSDGSRLRAFLETATPLDVQASLIRRFHWLVAQKGIEEVLQGIDDRLTVLLSQKNIASRYVQAARDRLYAYVCEVIVLPQGSDRRLTVAELIRQIENATTAYIAVPVLQQQQFVAALQAGNFDSELALLRRMRSPIPRPASPLLPRGEVVASVTLAIANGKTALLLGSVSKGKTTIAQLVANEVCADGWWYSVSSRSATETDNLLRALSRCMDAETTPSLVVVDDLDLSPAAHAAYGQSLSLVVSLASSSGRTLLLTARGTTSGLVQLADFQGIEPVDVPEMSGKEVSGHCLANGCPLEYVDSWGKIIRATTGGHPKLVQVRIIELSAGGWPAPSSAQFIAESKALTTARQFARRLLSATVPHSTAEFLYTASEAGTPLARPMLLSLSDEVGGMPNGGDIIDDLVGKWLEIVVADRYRVTPILKGAAAEAWTPASRKLAHRRLYDAIAGTRDIDVSDAAALLFHAYFAEDASRLTHCAAVLMRIGSAEISSAVFQHLAWVPYVALEPGERFLSANPLVSATLRQTQFAVANELSSDTLITVIERWDEEIRGIADESPRHAFQVMCWITLVSNRNPIIPLRRKLYSIDALRTSTGEPAERAQQLAKDALDLSRHSPGGIPKDATTSQFYLTMQSTAVRDLDDLISFLEWLEHDASEQSRLDLEAVLSWPLLDLNGAFIHGAWSLRHAETTDWAPTLNVLARAMALAQRFKLPRYGREAARALSIVYCEHVKDRASALHVLELAGHEFGNNVTLREQHINVHFQNNEHDAALQAWRALLEEPQTQCLDPFAYRRAALSACNLGLWAEAEKYFLQGSAKAAIQNLSPAKLGMAVDASYVAALSGSPQRAARMLSDALLDTPDAANDDSSESWEALFRATNVVLDRIEQHASGDAMDQAHLAYGRASEPGLSFGPATGEQYYRVSFTQTEASRLASQLGSVSPAYRDLLVRLQASKSPFLRYQAALAQLALEFHLGTGTNFPKLVASFERSFNVWTSVGTSGRPFILDEGDVEPSVLMTSESGWFAVFSAALLCCSAPQAELDSWRDFVASRWGAQCQIANDMTNISTGLTMASEEAWRVLRRVQPATRGELFGAALAAMQLGPRQPATLHSLQVVLASATISSEQGQMLQAVFSQAISRRFAGAWQQFLNAPFYFTAPRLTMPALQSAVLAAESGRSGLKSLLTATASAVGLSLGEVEKYLQ